MYEARSKDLILRRIREGLAKGAAPVPPAPDLTAPVHPPLAEELPVAFAQNFIAAGGTFFYCASDEDFFNQLYDFKQQHEINSLYVWEPPLQEYLRHGEISFLAGHDHFVQDAQAGLTTCEALLARTGSILLSSSNASGRRLSVYPERHIVVAHSSQIVADLKPALEQLRTRYGKNLPSMVSVVSGPSRTADIEKTLVLGAHGPRQLVLFLLDDGQAAPDDADHAAA